MKPIDILDALSHLPEEYIAFAVHYNAVQTASPGKAKNTASLKGAAMKNHEAKRKTSAVRFSRIGIAAAVAFCIGLNAALICGIVRMRHDDAVTLPAMTASPGSQQETAVVPDLNGMQWEEAKKAAAEAGFILAKQPVDSNGEPAGTVVFHCPEPNYEEPVGTIILCNVVVDPQAIDASLMVTIPKGYTGWYSIYVRNKNQEVLAWSLNFSADEYAEKNGMWGLCVDRQEEGTVVEAVLVDLDTKKEAVIGSYRLHQAPEAFSEEWHTFEHFDVITEDAEAAFQQVQ